MASEKLKKILNEHYEWLDGKIGGKRADLRGADLYGADLRDANLRGADLRDANLRGANLYGANLYGADLRDANLRGANLRGANLYGANLYGANLYGADLRDADLRDANLRGANLRGADLCGADLRDANLRGADLCGANLRDAKLELNLVNKFFPMVCPETGAFIGWKKCRDNTVVKLEILEEARRSSAYGRKCRCSAARVLAIENIDGTPYNANRINSEYDGAFWYTIGDIVSVENFDEDRRHECAPGIHFFVTRQEAVEW